MSIPLLLAKRGFHPRQLFAALQGAWLEPVQGSIWQENTGVTPTTTGGQTIGKIADQSGGGNNATQATVGNRPLLGRRYNLLTYSEDFSNSAWTRSNVNVSTDAEISPIGTLTADVLTPTTTGWLFYQNRLLATPSAPPGTSFTLSVWAKSADASTKTFKLFAINGEATSSAFTATSAWQRFTLTFTLTADLPYHGVTNNSTTDAIAFWGADLRLTADIGKDPAYQRITTATDYDYGQYPAAYHDTTDSLSVSLPNLGGGAFSASGSVYFATPVGMSALHNQSMGTSYTLPALSTDIYSWIVVPQRLSAVLENKLAIYMQRKAGIAGPDYLLDSSNNQLTADDGEQLLLAQ